MPIFSDNDVTVFVARRSDGAIYGVWTVRQFEGQEEVLLAAPEVATFFDAQKAPVLSGTKEQRARALQALADSDPEAAKFVEVLKAGGLL